MNLLADSFLCSGHVTQHTDNAEILVVYDVTNLEIENNACVYANHADILYC